MARNWLFVNIVLLAVVGMLGWQLTVQVKRFTVTNDIDRLKPGGGPKAQITVESPLTPPPVTPRYNPADFGVIAAQNLFTDTRGKVDTEETKVVETVPELNPKPLLVGVAIWGDRRIASVVEPQAGSGNRPGRRSSLKQVGDIYQGFTITDITRDQMVLEFGSRREVIPLYDGSKHSGQTGKTPILATRVVNFGSAGPGTGVAATVVASAGAAAPRATAAPGGPTSTAIGGSTPARPGAQPPETRPASPVNRQIPGEAQPATWNERIDEQGRRVIRTPFGDIVREKPPNP